MKTLNLSSFIAKLTTGTVFILLFADNLTLKRFTAAVSEEINSSPVMLSRINRSFPFKVMQNMVQYGDTKCFLGLLRDEDHLLNTYSEEQIFHYSAE